MIKQNRLLILAVGAVLPTLTPLNAAVLAGWDVNGLTGYGPSPLTADTDGTGLSVGGLTRGSGVSTGGTAAGNAWGGSGWDDANAYAQFTITPDANYSISYSTMDLNYRRSSSGPATGTLQYSTNGTTFTNVTSLSYSSSSSGGGLIDNINISSVGSGVTTTRTFRVLNSSGASGGTWYVSDRVTGDDMFVEGTATLRSASTLTWDGGQGNGNWNSYTGTAANQSNWNLNNIPATGIVDSLEFAGSTQTSTTNNISGLAVNNITFASGAGAFTNGGANAVTLNGNITNSSSNTQTINHGLALSAGSHTVSGAAAGNIAIGGNITGSGGALVKTGASALTLTGTNSYSGGTTITQGTLNANSTSALGSGAVLVNGGSLVSSGSVSGLGNLTLSTGSLAIGGSAAAAFSLSSTADFTMSGGLWTVNLGTSFDSINGTAGGFFAISGGELALILGSGFDYETTYQLLNGFGSGSVSGLTISGYDTENYMASLGTDGSLSFVSTAVPEPHEYAIATAALLLTVVALRRRKLRSA